MHLARVWRKAQTTLAVYLCAATHMLQKSVGLAGEETQAVVVVAYLFKVFEKVN